MSKIIQYRCPACSRLLIKWETGSDKVLYFDPQARWVETGEGKRKDIICSKCLTRSEVCCDGLRKIELKPVSDTSELPELANHIGTPA